MRYNGQVRSPGDSAQEAKAGPGQPRISQARPGIRSIGSPAISGKSSIHIYSCGYHSSTKRSRYRITIGPRPPTAQTLVGKTSIRTRDLPRCPVYPQRTKVVGLPDSPVCAALHGKADGVNGGRFTSNAHSARAGHQALIVVYRTSLLHSRRLPVAGGRAKLLPRSTTAGSSGHPPVGCADLPRPAGRRRPDFLTAAIASSVRPG